jgi:hypothetical protein
MNILDTIDRIGVQEEMITEKEIISPIFYNREIITRIEGIIYRLEIPKTDPGWYSFKAINNKRAKVTSPADIDKIQRYLNFLPKVRLILVFKKKKAYFGVPMKSNNWNFKVNDLLPIFLFDDTAEDFAKCICRYDGANLWFDSIDMSGDPIRTDYLRESIKKLRTPGRIKHFGLTLEEKIAYSIKYKLDKKIADEKKKGNIQRDVEYAGGKFIESKERSDHLFVTYEVDGHTFNSVISKDPAHWVITAGICLTDHGTGREGDKDFDLKSLISVIQEGQRSGQISRAL